MSSNLSLKSISVKNLYEEKKDEFQLEILAGDAFLDSQMIVSPDFYRPGLALAGYTENFLKERVQIIGRTELSYLEILNAENKQQAIERVMVFVPPCFIITKGLEVPKIFNELAERYRVPVLRTTLDTTPFIHLLTAYLDYRLAPETYVHGDLVDVYGVGLLIVGESGIGKSECALDLVERGHRLIADDLIKILRRGEGIIMGYSAAKTPLLQHHIEIRGVGIVDIYALYGIRAIRTQKRIEVQVELVRWTKELDYERIGLEENYTEILGVKIPLVRIPVIAGKNLALVCEVIAKNHLLKIFGYHPAKAFNDELMKLMGKTKIDPWITDDME